MKCKVRFAEEAKIFLFPNNSDRSGAHPTSCSVDAGALTSGVNGPGNDSGNSSPSSADVKNVWSYITLSQYAFNACCLIKHRNHCTLHLYQEILITIEL